MWNLNDVTQIEYKSDYSFLIVFDDGTSAVIDFSGYLQRGPIFSPLKDHDFFRQANENGVKMGSSLHIPNVVKMGSSLHIPNVTKWGQVFTYQRKWGQVFTYQ